MGPGLSHAAVPAGLFFSIFANNLPKPEFIFACRFGGGLSPSARCPLQWHERTPSLHDHIQPSCQPHCSFFLDCFCGQNTKKHGHLFPCWMSSLSLLTLLGWCFSQAVAAEGRGGGRHGWAPLAVSRVCITVSQGAEGKQGVFKPETTASESNWHCAGAGISMFVGNSPVFQRAIILCWIKTRKFWNFL